MKLIECQRCNAVALEKLNSHTICHNCNWSPDLSQFRKKELGLTYYYPLDLNLMKQINEILGLIEGRYPKIA